MDIKTARRKSIDVLYVEVDEDNIEDVAVWSRGSLEGEGNERFVKLVDKHALNARQTKAFVGDFVLKYGTSFKSFSKKAFEKSYEDIKESVSQERTRRQEEKVVAHARSTKTGRFVKKEEAEQKPWTGETKIKFTQKGSGVSIMLDPNERPPGPYMVKGEHGNDLHYDGDGNPITEKEYMALVQSEEE